jgi:hypothetical protein
MNFLRHQATPLYGNVTILYHAHLTAFKTLF